MNAAASTPFAPASEDFRPSLPVMSACLETPSFGRQDDSSGGRARESILDFLSPDSVGAERRRQDAAMSFLEGAENCLSVHQAELIRLVCRGLGSEAALAEARYLLDRARRTAAGRPPSRPLEDPYQEYVMDFVESMSGCLSYPEAEILRRAARGCGIDDLDEIQYLLGRVRKGRGGNRRTTH